MFGGSSRSNIPHFNNNKTTDSDDCYCESGPDDTITQIRFSNVSKIEDDPEFISASSWDSTIRVWEINHSYSKLQTKFMADFNFDAPVLGQCWMDDNSWILGACADNTVKAWDLAGNKLNTVAKHASAAKDVYYDSYNKIIISSGFDGHLMFWDGRDSKPVFDVNFEPYKIWSLSFADPLGKSKPDLEYPSPLKYQTRSVEAFPNGCGFAVSSIEGRCGVKYIDFKHLKDKYNEDFNFKCHRSTDYANNVYPVHQMSFNATYLTFMTCGGDGNYFIWDKEKRKRLKSTMGCDSPITACRMSLNAKLAAYAFGYDWAKGMYGAGTSQVGLFIHPTIDKEVRSSI